MGRTLLILLGALLFSGVSFSATTRSFTIVPEKNNYKNALTKVGAPASFIYRDDLGIGAQDDIYPNRHSYSGLYFINMSDTHIRDEDTPTQFDLFTYSIENMTNITSNYPVRLKLGILDSVFEEAFKPQRKYSVYVLDNMNKSINRLTSSIKRKFDFAVVNGDMTCGSLYNEFRWFIDIMDGKKKIDPVSGVGSINRNLLNDNWDTPFISEGLKNIPWYVSFGNHEAMVEGTFPITQKRKDIAIGTIPVTEEWREKLQNAFPKVDSLIKKAIELYLSFGGESSPIKVITPDKNRRLLDKPEIAQELFNSTSYPHGHGFSLDNISQNKYYYTFDSENKIFRFIVLDTNTPYTSLLGAIDKEQFAWLKEQLDVAQSEKRLVVIMSHHGYSKLVPSESYLQSKVLNTGSLIIVGYDPSENLSKFVLPSDFKNLLFQYPNVFLHITGHTHKNKVSAMKAPSTFPSKGYWEITTSSFDDWPQQSRILEILFNNDGTGSIASTMLNFDADNDGQANISRKLALSDAMKNSTINDHEGTNIDQNVLLRFEIPKAIFEQIDFNSLKKDVTSFKFGGKREGLQYIPGEPITNDQRLNNLEED